MLGFDAITSSRRSLMSLGCDVANRTRNSGEISDTRRIRLRKIDRSITIRIDVLSQQRHLPVTVLEQAAGFVQNSLRIAAALHAPRIRHHAVRTIVVAPAHDGDITAHAVAIEPHGSDFGVGFLAGKQDIDAPAPFARFAHQAGQVAVRIRTGDDIHGVLPFEQPFPQTFGHTTDNTDEHSRPAAAQMSHLPQTPPNALFGIISDRTGIDQNDIRLLDLVGIDIALLLHDRNDDFRIADVHLTAVCFDKKFTARTLQRTQSIYLLVIHSCKTGLAR